MGLHEVTEIGLNLINTLKTNRYEVTFVTFLNGYM